MMLVSLPDSRRATRQEPGAPLPDRAQHSIADRERVVLVGTRSGRSAIELSHDLGVTTRSVVRIRARLRAQGLLS